MSELVKEYQRAKVRFDQPSEGSYTNYLYEKGLDKILKKVGEEASEVIIAAKNQQADELVGELADLWYHMVVLMVNEGIELEQLEACLAKRAEKTGNLKAERKPIVNR